MKMEGNGCFIDTNLLVYSSGINLSLCQKSRQLLSSLYDKFDYLAISPQIIREFLVVVTHPLTSEKPFSITEATHCIEKFTETLVVLPEDDAIVEKLFQLISKYNIVGKRIHDANVVALMLSHQIHHLATANEKDFARFTEIEIIAVG
jgi:predicted nucleic acid-binding protein